jgi:hypothetical protein
VLELKIREHPPSMLRNIDGGPPESEGTQCLRSLPLGQAVLVAEIKGQMLKE